MVFTKKLIILTTTLSLFSLTQASLDSFFSQLALGYLPHYQSKKALRLSRSLDALKKTTYAYEGPSRKYNDDRHTLETPNGSIDYSISSVDGQEDAYIHALKVSDHLKRGQGVGGGLLLSAFAFIEKSFPADKKSLIVEWEVFPFLKNRMTKEELATWYESFGASRKVNGSDVKMSIDLKKLSQSPLFYELELASYHSLIKQEADAHKAKLDTEFAAWKKHRS